MALTEGAIEMDGSSLGAKDGEEDGPCERDGVFDGLLEVDGALLGEDDGIPEGDFETVGR